MLSLFLLSCESLHAYRVHIKSSKEVIKRCLFKHLVNINFLEWYCWLQFHIYILRSWVNIFIVVISILNWYNIIFSWSLFISTFLNFFNLWGFLATTSFYILLILRINLLRLPFHRWNLNLCVFFQILSNIHEHKSTLLHIFLIINVNFHVELEAWVVLEILNCLLFLII